MLFSHASHTLLRRGLPRSAITSHRQTRSMGGGSYMTVSETHRRWGEVFTVACWLWIFHRARQDLPVVLGYRHAWEHAHDPFDPPGYHSASSADEATASSGH